MSNTLLESLWARVDTNIGSRITKISELLTQSLSANDESKAARDAAAASATEAKNHADRAELATDVSGLRDEVTQQIAAVVDGSPAALDTIREVAEYAQANRGITDQLNAAIGNKADKSHTHTTSQVTGLDTALNGKANTSHTHSQSQITGLSTALSGKADKSHTHTSADITDAVDHIHGGRAGRLVQVGEHGHIRDGNRPTDQYDLTNKMYVDEEVDKKANTSHTHTTADITDFSTEMGKKADKSHTHSQSDITGLSTALSGKANSSHTHTTADITNFATEMGKKADKTHTHSQSQVSGLSTALNGKADKSYVDGRIQLVTALPSNPDPTVLYLMEE